MRLRVRLVWVLALVVLAIGGCEDVYTPPETAPVELTIQGVEQFFGQTKPLEGVQVCEGDTDENCDFSNANGEVTIELPVDQQIFYTFEKEGYDSLLIAQVIPKRGKRTFWIMFADDPSAEWYESVGSPYPRRGTGEISIGFHPPLAGATLDLVGATGTPYYSVENPDENPLDPTATTPRGIGGFIEVTPGEYQVEWGGTASHCVHYRYGGSGWPGDVENSVIVPVREDYLSEVFVACPPPP